ncbi:MAG TPA: metallophosphoesterase, partial [Gemmatimonadales bacterium]|nr:metallophosphoesterase [Gemmatimonadales bacterium]
MIGLFLHPRRYPPARERRPPLLERVTKRPLGWVAERLARPLMRWDRARLETPEIAVPVPGLLPGLVGYRLALVTDLHHGPAVPTWWLERMGDRVRELDTDLVVLGGDFVSHARSDIAGLEQVLARFRGRDGVVAVLGNHDH